MKRYKQLIIGQRYQIYGLKKAGFDQSEIAGELKVNKSTISRELKRNVGERETVQNSVLAWFKFSARRLGGLQT
jgi:IS30 family transposase